MFLQKLIFKIQHIGYTEQLSDYEKKRLVVFNKLNATGFALAVLNLIFTIAYCPEFFSSTSVYCYTAIVLAFVLMTSLIIIRYYIAATVVSFALLPALLTLSNITTAGAGTEMYLILYMMLAFFFLHKIRNIAIPFVYCLVLFLVLHYKYQNSVSGLVTGSVPFYFSVFNYLCSFSMIFYTMYLIKFQVWNYEKSIRQKKEMLRLNNANLLAKTRQVKEQSLLLEQKNIELTELNNVKIKLFSIISHDLRTSVYGLKNVIDSLLTGRYSKEEMMKSLPGVSAEVDNCIVLMDNLFSWARNQLHESTISLQELDLCRMANSTFMFYSKRAADKNIQLVNNASPETYAYADADMINTVLRNLVGNALKFTHSGGKIEIATESMDGFVKLSVKDTGVGITENEVKQIFSNEYFTTLGTEKEMGTGLGLMICRDFVKSNNGDFSIESKKGEGASFNITLPVLEAAYADADE